MEPKKPPSKPRPAKKPYAKPQFRMYGNITQITSAVGMVGALDGGMVSSMSRTR